MIEVANASSLLEIMFAVNAVFFVVYSRYKGNIQKLYSKIVSEAVRHGVTLDEAEEEYLTRQSRNQKETGR